MRRIRRRPVQGESLRMKVSHSNGESLERSAVPARSQSTPPHSESDQCARGEDGRGIPQTRRLVASHVEVFETVLRSVRGVTHDGSIARSACPARSQSTLQRPESDLPKSMLWRRPLRALLRHRGAGPARAICNYNCFYFFLFFSFSILNFLLFFIIFYFLFCKGGVQF